MSTFFRRYGWNFIIDGNDKGHARIGEAETQGTPGHVAE